MSDVSAKIADLIHFSSGQKPLEFETTFKDLLQDKVAAAIENKKLEIASKMFNAPEVENDEEEQELELETTDSEESETEEQEDGEAT